MSVFIFPFAFSVGFEFNFGSIWLALDASDGATFAQFDGAANSDHSGNATRHYIGMKTHIPVRDCYGIRTLRSAANKTGRPFDKRSYSRIVEEIAPSRREGHLTRSFKCAVNNFHVIYNTRSKTGWPSDSTEWEMKNFHLFILPFTASKILIFLSTEVLMFNKIAFTFGPTNVERGYVLLT